MPIERRDVARAEAASTPASASAFQAASPRRPLFHPAFAMRTFAAVFEAAGREVASYAVFAETPERALAMLDGTDWPEDADRLRILDEEGRETLLVAQTKRGQALTLSVKRRSPNGTVGSALARDYGEAVRLRDECTVQGYEAWIEDADGRIVR